MGQIRFQNRSIEFEVVRLDRFCCPIALTIAVQNLCAVLVSHRVWRLHAITNHNLNLDVSHSTRFLLFLSNSQVSPKFKESMLRVPFTHKAQIRCVMSEFLDDFCRDEFLDDFCHALHFVVTHACATFCRTYYVPLPDKPQKVRKTGFLCRDFKKEKWDRFGANPIN